MDLEALLRLYGYPLLFAGVFAEGESLLLLAGYFANRDYLDLPAVMATAFIAAVSGDQFFFHLGRRRGKALLARFPRLEQKVQGTLARVERNQAKFVLGMRFLWGLRIALPIALGLTTMSARRYLLLDLVSAAIWSVTITLVGYFAGKVVTGLIEDLQKYERWVVLSLIAVAVMVISLRWLPKSRT